MKQNYNLRLFAEKYFITAFCILFFITTIKLNAQEAPGGVSDGLELWLKAGEDFTYTDATYAEWLDQSNNAFVLNSAYVLNPDGNASPNISSTTLNFNAALYFDGNHTGLSTQVNEVDFSFSEWSIYSVQKVPDIGNGPSPCIWTYADDNNNFNNTLSFFIDPTEFNVTVNGTKDIILSNPVLDDNVTHIFGYTADSGSTELYLDAKNINTHGGQASPLTGPGAFMVGLDADGGQAVDGDNHLKGDVSEIFFYNRKLTALERSKVETYLAIKYGKTLDQNTATDYVVSNGSAVWDASANTAYNQTVFGIGRDDASGLDQRVSKSVNDIVSIALDLDFTSLNNDVNRTSNHINNLQFLMLSNNNGSISETTAELPTGNFFARVAREWRVEKTANFNQNVHLKFDGFDENWKLYKDSDGDFSFGAVQIASLNANGEAANVQLNDGDVLTLVKIDKSPGGVFAGLELWLNAEEGFTYTNAMNAEWLDQSANAFVLKSSYVYEPTPGDLAPNISSNTLNFHSALYFDGNNTALSTQINQVDFGFNQWSIYSVQQIPPINPSSSAQAVWTYTDKGRNTFNFFVDSDEFNLNVNNARDVTITSPNLDDNITHIFGYTADSNSTEIYLDAENISTHAGQPAALNGAGGFMVGLDCDSYETQDGGNHLKGDIGEIFFYNHKLSALERQKIESYLAIKYGKSLDQSTVTNYVASNGSAIWDASANSTYATGIFGIGRDVASGLDQRVSTSSDDILTIALDNDFVSVNHASSRTTQHLNDLQFLFFSNNGEGIYTTSNEVEFGRFNKRIAKEWKVEKTTNFSQTIHLKFDGFDETWSVYADMDGDFTSGSFLLGDLTTDGKLLHTLVEDGMYISLAKNEPVEYVWENNVWTPASPVGNATFSDNISVINGSVSLAGITEINDITVNSGASLTIESVLYINGDIVNNGEFIFSSDASGNGELGPVPENSSITGDITVQRYMLAKRSYRMVSSAVTTSTSIHANWQEGATSAAANPANGFGTHITGTLIDQENGFDATPSGNSSMYTIDVANQQFEAIANTNSNTLIAGNPYLLFVRGDRGIDVTSNQATPTATRLRASGTLLTGNQVQNFNVTNPGDFVMIGNPYQASVDINNVISNSNNLDANEYYVYDPSLGDHGAYVTVSLPDGLNTTSGSSSANQYLQPGQGAQIATLNAGLVSILFKEESKKPGAAQFTSTNREQINASELASITGQLYTTSRYNNGESLHDSFGVFFHHNFSNSFTEEDAAKPYNFGENMGIQVDDQLVSIEKRKLPTEEEEVLLFSDGYAHTNYSLVLSLNGLEDYEIYLKDTNNQSLTALNDGENVFVFSVDPTNPNSINADRFKIVFAEQSLDVTANSIDKFMVYPNPLNDDQLYITTASMLGQTVKVSLVDMLGREVFTSLKTFKKAEVSIDTAGLPSGIYILHLKNNGQVITTQKIVKQ
ncbi:T9SS type A sorting domain-containing protein [Haloflavibacter putidus]|uniref:T9SS type A sorting domain-containing protein n=1 Tax=Haloflavibacter putidus TaxID=2576776 RepID=A0A507ZGZ6_9FLAO|nr:T9SS type A sorting domain-containing protein [Haloflavibacter putidus]TQD36227.1 T9SS type A sorting domain-containing protein [Haloflavibacter putidus]